MARKVEITVNVESTEARILAMVDAGCSFAVPASIVSILNKKWEVNETYCTNIRSYTTEEKSIQTSEECIGFKYSLLESFKPLLLITMKEIMHTLRSEVQVLRILQGLAWL